MTITSKSSMTKKPESTLCKAQCLVLGVINNFKKGDYLSKSAEVCDLKDLKICNLTTANATLMIYQNYVYTSHAIA